MTPRDPPIPASNKVVKRAFRDWIGTGTVDRSVLRESRESRAIGATVDVGVGVGATTITNSILIPTGFDRELHTAQNSYGQLVGALRNFETSDGQALKVALLDDTEQSLSVIGESLAVTETDPNLGGLVSYVDELPTGLCVVSNSLLADSSFSASDFIESTFAQRYYRGRRR